MTGKIFVPVETEIGERAIRPVQWYVLIRDMEEFRHRTGWGLAGSWRYVHHGDYENARRQFDATWSAYVEHKRRKAGGEPTTGVESDERVGP